MRNFPASLLERVEAAIYLTAGYVLAFAAAVLLGYAVWEALHVFTAGDLGQAVVHLLDRVLLALMIAEIIYTVARFSREGSLEPEPFLVIGVIASVRRMLVITAESASGIDIDNPHYQAVLLELALLILGIPLFALAIRLIRRR
jgi:uncharacterized membrane protein (DUF373 family)